MTVTHNIVKLLVKHFREQETAYLSPGYQESQVRQDFIDKFFTALGWDVTHEVQKNPYEQEVKIENKVNTSGSQRRADYAFFVAPNFRDVKFFVEAKKPSRSLTNPNDYYQAIRYGWNSKTPIAVLTDFEEFHILDCRFKPDIKTALDRTLEKFHYTDYEDEEKFKKLFYLLSRNEVANGSIEKYSATLPKPRGKGAKQRMFKTEYKAVDEAFLEALDGYREQLARAFKNKNQNLEGEELTEAVQRTIDRLVFIRFLEDKSIEEPSIAAIKDRADVWKAFVGLCKRLEPKYNGLVFKPHRFIDSPDFNPPDDKMFAEICDELANPTSPYDFDKIPISILGSIYERFLGKVVSTTDKRAKVIEKPEVRKAGGVYYTPEYIVRYIVNETVGKLLYEHASTPSSERRTQSLSEKEFGTGSMTAEDSVTLSDPAQRAGESKGVTKFKLTPAEVAKLKIIDIACGSGSFLIEVYNQLLDYHTKYYNEFPDKTKKGDIETREGKTVLSLKKRQEILVNNIYGVDIDFQATEVTQLSLYLKLLEDVTMNDAFQYSLLKEKILPDLKSNIVCGNSLIGRDILEGKLFDDETEHTLKPMNFEDVFPDIMLRGGFDVVVGNPPYSTVTDEHIKEYVINRFSSAEGRFDTFELFIQRAINLCRNKGKLGYIIPNTLLTNLYSRKLRKFILDSTTIEQIVNFGIDVFTDPTIHTCIIITSRENPEKNAVKVKKQITQVAQLSLNPDFELSQTQFENNPNYIFDIFFDPETRLISNKLFINAKQLGEICFIRQCIKTGDDEKYVKKSDVTPDKKWKSTLRGRSIERYVTHETNLFLKYGPWLARNWKNKSFYETQKIAIRETGNRIISTLDIENRYFLSSLYAIYPKSVTEQLSLKFILGILNSNLATYFVKKTALELTKGAFTKVRTNQLAKLPIRTINFEDAADKARHDNIVKLVEQMLDAKAKLANAKTESETNRFEMLCKTLDRQINESVYELYGLTEEEIRIVEGKK